MYVLVSHCLHDRGETSSPGESESRSANIQTRTLFCHTQECMRLLRGAHRVYRDGHRAISSVLEACMKDVSGTVISEFQIRTNGERDTRG